MIWAKKGDRQVKKDDIQMTQSGNIQPIHFLMLQWRTAIQSHQYIIRNGKHCRNQDFDLIGIHLFPGVLQIRKNSLRQIE